MHQEIFVCFKFRWTGGENLPNTFTSDHMVLLRFLSGSSDNHS